MQTHTNTPLDPWLSRRAPGQPPLLVLGCMNLGSRTPDGESRAILERALHHGIRCFDTANMYGNGASEKVVGQALRGVAGVRVATKVGLWPIKGRPEGLSPQHLPTAVEASLERLGQSQLEVLFLHAPDHAVPVVETLTAVAALQRAGKVVHLGVSNHAAWQVLELMFAADGLGMPRPRTSQVMLNLAIRQIELEYTRFAARYALHTTVYNPLAGGLFARALDANAPPPPGSRFDGNKRYQDRYWSPRLFSFATQARDLAQQHGLTLLDLAYGWLMQHPGVDSILLGPATVGHLDDAVAACARVLPKALLTQLAALQRAFDGTDASYAR